MSDIKLFLVIALFMCVVKPFAGFSLCSSISSQNEPSSILAKSFTQRKQEYTDDSEYDIAVIQKNLAHPVLLAILLFSFFLDCFLSVVLYLGKKVTGQMVASLNLSLSAPQPLYLLAGKLTI